MAEVNLKICPYSEKHHVCGGHPEYVCTDCATEWVITKTNGHPFVIYTHFDVNGNTLHEWKVPLTSGTEKRRRLRTA